MQQSERRSLIRDLRLDVRLFVHLQKQDRRETSPGNDDETFPIIQYRYQHRIHIPFRSTVAFPTDNYLRVIDL